MIAQFNQLLDYLLTNPLWIGGLLTLSIVMFLASLLLIPYIILSIPENYFTDDARHESALRQNSFALYLLLRVSKNLFGLLALLAGIIMLVLPGQGLLAILIGISLLDFPGKYQLERALIRKPKISQLINWIRLKGNKKPLLIP